MFYGVRDGACRHSLSASRRGFLVGTILVFVAIFVCILLAGARAVPEWMAYFVLAGILAQVVLIHRREQALYPSRRWRFWYALVIAGFACDLMTRYLWMSGHDTIADPVQIRGRLMVGPVMLRLIIRNQKA